MQRRQALHASVALLPWPAAAATRPRVAALDWALAETLLALGHPPVAIVAALDWNRYVVEPRLPEGVADLGLQPDINFERLAALAPDVVLTSPFTQQLEPALARIAPVERFSIFEPGPVPLARPRALLLQMGERLGRAALAQAWLDAADRLLDGWRARLATQPQRPLLLVNFIDARHVRVYGGAGLYQNVLDRLGLVNAWSGPTSYWGYATVGIERLATPHDVQLFMFEPVPPDAQATLRRSPLWTQLPFVQAGRVSVLPSVLMFGAMPSALRFARLITEQLAA